SPMTQTMTAARASLGLWPVSPSTTCNQSRDSAGSLLRKWRGFLRHRGQPLERGLVRKLEQTRLLLSPGGDHRGGAIPLIDEHATRATRSDLDAGVIPPRRQHVHELHTEQH